MNILQLNDHCLKRIFMHMNQEHLLVIASTHPRFSVPTKLTFREKFSRNYIVVSNNVIDSILVNGVHDADVSVVKCFGDQILKLRISIDLDYGLVDKLERLLSAVWENGGCKLIKLRIFLHCMDEESTASQQSLQIVRPFIQKFSSKFQNLRSLGYEDYNGCSNNIFSLQDFVHHLPQLTQFSFIGNFSLENLQKFMELNPGLEDLRMENKSLSIYSNSCSNYDIMALIDTLLPQLKYLELRGYFRQSFDEGIVSPTTIQFGNLTTLILEGNVFSDLFCPESEKSLCLKLKQLKTISVYTLHWSWSLNEIQNIILCNDQLTNIDLSYFTGITTIEYSTHSEECFLNFWDLFENIFWFHVCNGADVDKFVGIIYHFNNVQWRIICDEFEKTVSLKRI